MKLNTKSRMAIAAILDVAMHGTDKPVSLAGVSERQDISLSYLEQLFRLLRERGFVVSSRGPGGGYRLNKRLSAISVADIVDAVDRKADGQGGGAENGRGENSCHAHRLWTRVEDYLHEYLRKVTLDSILEEAEATAHAPSARDAGADAMAAFVEDRVHRNETLPSPAIA